MNSPFVRIILGLAILVVLVAGSIPFLVTRERDDEGPVIGYARIVIDAPHRGRSVTVSVWYPARNDRQPVLLGQNALFYGFHAIPDGKAIAGPHPLVLLSHGSGGNAQALGWFAASLAKHGYIVVAPDHPGTMSNDSVPELTPHIWLRTADLSLALDAVIRDRPLGLDIDPRHITAAGFSLGGATVLALSGAHLSKDAFMAYCAGPGDKPDCRWMIQNGVDFGTIDRSRYEADLSDDRVTQVIAIDPALVAAMTPASLKAMQKPALLVNLGSKEQIPEAMDAIKAKERISASQLHYLEGAHHFSFLAECSLMGVAIIGMAGDDNICSDMGFRSRDAVHIDVLRLVLEFLQPER